MDAVLHPDATKFPVGTTVKAYKRSNMPGVWDQTGAPRGSQDASATVASDGSVTFTGLAENTQYLIYAASPDRWANFLTKKTNPAVVLHGVGAPASTVGSNGDFYINDSTGDLYGPKASGAWPGSAANTSGGATADASTTTKGVAKLATAPASPSNPIAVGDNDPRNSDARTPTAHKASHATGGSDVLAPSDIGAATAAGLTAETSARTAADALLAPLASPTFTGTPAAPTAAQGTNTTQLASTAYVQTEVGLLVPKSLVDAKGDLLVGTADNTVARKAVGTDGMLLRAKSANSDGLEWVNPGDFQYAWADIPVPDLGSSENTLTVGANAAVFGLFIVRAAVAANRLGFVVEVSSGNVDVGIYKSDGTGGLPGTRVTSSGSTAAPGGFSTGGLGFTGVVLTPGMYWAAIAADNGSFQVHGITCTRWNAALNRSLKATQTSAFPLPATAAATASTSAAASNPPLLIPTRA